MKRNTLGALLAVATNLLALSGARAEAASPALVAQTRHFAFYAFDSKLRVKARESERFLSEIGTELGLEYDGQIRYYRYSYPEEVAVHAGALASGVSLLKQGEIHSTQEFHAHEIVHMMLAQVGNPGTFLSEGAAVFLGDRGRFNDKDVDAIAKSAVREVAFQDLLQRFAQMDTGVSYPLAGSFVRYVAKRYGTARLVDLLRAVSSQGAENGFEAALGVSLDQIVRDWARSLGTTAPATRTAGRYLNSAYSLMALAR